MSKRKRESREYYISIDMESDGPCPLVNSMLQFGAVFYDADGNVLEEFLANIHEIDGGVQDPSTMAWWAEQEVKNPGLWDSMMTDRVTPLLAMQRFESMVQKHSRELKASPLVVAYPAGFDFTWLYVYLCKFLGRSCVGFSALDMKTLAMALLKKSYHDSAKKRFPASWFNKQFKHTHNALDDARGQGYTFFQMKQELFNIWDNCGDNPVYPEADEQPL